MKNERFFKLNLLSKACLFALGISSLSVMAAEEENNSTAAKQADEEMEVIEIKGVFGSIRDSMNDKRFSTEIKDSISAEDIGQLPDENIAEALQRVTGIQMARSADGEGSTLQIRGLTNNNVEINGQSVSGSSADRSINFQDLPSELFSGLEVLKAPTSDKIEGSLGGTVNLKTRRPLEGKKDFFASATLKAKHAEIAGETDPDINGFLKKNWRDTGIGDFGFIVNVGIKTVTSVTEAYGGGDFATAEAVWVRRNGDYIPAGPGNPNSGNANHFKTGDEAWRYDGEIDVNGDGESNVDDVYYMPAGFGFYENTRESDRNSFNTTLQWQPNDDINIFFDATLTDIEEVSTGSRYSVSFNSARLAALSSGDNNFVKLNSIPGSSAENSNALPAGDVYLMTSGRIGNATTRMGASPSINIIDRESEQFTLGGDWQITDEFNLSAELSMSKGTASTVEQGALIMGIDANGNGQLNGLDFSQFVDFDSAAGRIPDVTLYQSPFPASAFGTGLVLPDGDLVAIAPNDVDYERLAYFQFNRVAGDTENQADAFRIDGTLDIDGDFITELFFGVRAAERKFSRIGYENRNQRGGPSSLWNGEDELRTGINVQAIRVNPESLSDPDLIASSEFLQACLTQGGDNGLLSDEGSNLPRTWTATNCSANHISDAFGLQDIRTIDEETQIGAYELARVRFQVKEQTIAAYIRADFYTDISDMDFFGNFGIRYVETDSDSTGIAPTEEGQSVQTFSNSYDDWLPSFNANLAINEEMVVRLGLSRTLGRPELIAISPSMNITLSEDVEGIDGSGTAGNPYLDPQHSNNIDLSFEWYYSDSSMFSLAYYRKDIDSTIADNPDEVDIDFGDKTYRIRTKQNLPGTEIDGFEIALQHGFTDLPGLLSHTGIGMNYTVTDEASEIIDQEGSPIARQRLSDSSYNIAAYYDDGTFSTRLAYNWRDEFVRRIEVDLGFARGERLPEIEAERGQLDLTANYTLNEHIKFNFAAINLTESETERFMKYEQLTNYIANAGRRYTLGMVYRF